MKVLRAVVLVAFAAGCIESNTVRCGDAVCPAGYTCNTATSTCIDPAEADACGGHPDGDPCSVRGLTGSCLDGLCQPAFCGDGRRTLDEECDGTDLGGDTCASLHYYGETTGLACKADCTFDRSGCVGACGDGIKNGDELCDGDDFGSPPADCTNAGFYDAPGLKCSPFCTYDTSSCTGTCGDGITNGEELCDGAPPSESCFDAGFDVGTLACSTACGFGFAGCAHIGWRVVTNPSLTTLDAQPPVIHASSSTDIWVANDAGTATHFNGSSWASRPIGTKKILSIWSADATHAWACDTDGVLWRWDGTTWAHDMTTNVPTGVKAIWGLSATDLWVVSPTAVSRWNGSTWSAMGSIGSVNNLSVIQGASDTDVWVSDNTIVMHWNGTSWSSAVSVGSSITVNAFYTVSPTDAWAVGTTGTSGVAAHWNGVSWTPTYISYGTNLWITGSASNDLWVTVWDLSSTFSAMHYDGNEWLPVQIQMQTGARVFELDPGNVFAASATRIDHMSGLVYAKNDPNCLGSPSIFSTPDGCTFLGPQSGQAMYFKNSTWSAASLDGANVRTSWGTACNDTWLATDFWNVYHFNGSTFGNSSTLTFASTAPMWGSGSSDVWYGGTNGQIRHYGGSTWDNRDIAGFSSGANVIKISGSGPSDVWVLSNDDRLFRWTGSWAEVTGVPTPIDDMAVTASNNVVVVGNGKAFHGNASGWTADTLPSTGTTPSHLVVLDAQHVYGATATDLFLYDGARWSQITPPNLTNILGATNPAIAGLAVTPDRLDVEIIPASPNQTYLRSLVITRPWQCLATEAGHCSDAIDNDCDGTLDARDSDCP